MHFWNVVKRQQNECDNELLLHYVAFTSFHCSDNIVHIRKYTFLALSYICSLAFFIELVFIIEIYWHTKNSRAKVFSHIMNFSLRQLYCLLFTMALLFALSEGRDHRLDHILRLKRRNLNANPNLLPFHSYSSMNSGVFQSKYALIFL